MSARKKLTDILGAARQDDLAAAWDHTTAAGEFSPLPTGEYACRILSGELFTSNNKATPGYKITFEVIEGEHAGRRLWYDLWLTPAALRMAKRDLAKLGIDTEERFRLLLRAELHRPQGILARVKAALRTDNEGAAYNQVRSFEVTGTEPPDAFAPTAPPDRDAGESAVPEPPAAIHPKGSPNGRKLTAASPGSNGPYRGGPPMTCGSPYGFRIVGDLSERRRLVDAGRALAGYCACEPRAEVRREAYLSAFDFPGEFEAWMDSHGTPRGYAGPCGASYLWFDIDEADDLDAAHRAARRLAGALLHRYRALDEDDLLTFFSGSKGFHVGLPPAWGPLPSPTFNLTARVLAGRLAEMAGVKIDAGVYDKVRAFRAPNSRHPKTGLHKRRLSHGELMGLSLERVRDLAREPLPFDLPETGAADPTAAADWSQAEAGAMQEAEAKARYRAEGAASGPTLNRRTLDFIRDGAASGDRHRILFSAAANLAEFGCPPALAHALLTEAGRDIGLSPADVRRQIDCGLSHDRPPETHIPEDHAP